MDAWLRKSPTKKFQMEVIPNNIARRKGRADTSTPSKSSTTLQPYSQPYYKIKIMMTYSTQDVGQNCLKLS